MGDRLFESSAAKYRSYRHSQYFDRGSNPEAPFSIIFRSLPYGGVPSGTEPHASGRNKGAEGALSCCVGTSGGGHDLCWFVYVAIWGWGIWVHYQVTGHK